MPLTQRHVATGAWYKLDALQMLRETKAVASLIAAVSVVTVIALLTHYLGRAGNRCMPCLFLKRLVKKVFSCVLIFFVWVLFFLMSLNGCWLCLAAFLHPSIYLPQGTAILTGLGVVARHDSAALFSIVRRAFYSHGLAWIFIRAYCFAIP